MELSKVRTVSLMIMVVILFSFVQGNVQAQGLTSTSVWLDDFAGSLDLGMESSDAQMCEGNLGECEDLSMDSDAHGRLLRRIRYYISYGALSANRVPCPPRSGRSYYTRNCYRAQGPVHPYRRGCSAITRCRRYTG